MAFKLVVSGTFGDIVELRLLKWHKEPGALVKSGDLLVEVETDKAIVEVRAKQDGVLRTVLVPDGEFFKLDIPCAVLTKDLNESIAGVPEQMPVFETDLHET
jgi:pyruvate/2-oxoglutarate dehydrogenase complex dihydrolipoamide acyltransferase (E2) component